MGIAPTGVEAVKLSSSTCAPVSLSWAMIQRRASARAGEPAGRGPKLTNCFKSAKARVPLKVSADASAANPEETAKKNRRVQAPSPTKGAGNLGFVILLFLIFPIFPEVNKPGQSNA